ncbi:MAG: hypothetical protein CVU79_12870, partial [Elusimicrobia bacterium HGW-Elusimicrobia-3]
MKIRAQFIITMLLFGIILVVIALSALITSHRVEKAGNQERIAAGIAQGASELSYLANDYLIYRESQQLNRWQSRFTSFSAQVAGLNVDEFGQQALVRNIQANQQRLKEVFDSVVSAVGNASPKQKAAFDPAFLHVPWSRMAVQSQGLISDASRLSLLFHQEMDRLGETRSWLMYVMVGLFGAFLLASYMLTYRRILKSIATLQAGAKVIGSGNLDFRIEERGNDEIGELSHSFNRMTSDLKAVTASKADLEREVAERQQAEERLRQQREWLQVTLTSIGDAVVATDTESKISFLNPVAAALTGWRIEEALGRPVQDLFRTINEKTREPGEDIVGRVLREGGIVALANHTALVARDGREIPIEDSAAPIRDRAGSVAGVVLVFHDVTEKRRSVEALRRSAQFPEENPNPVLRIAPGGGLLYANAPARTWLATFGSEADGSLPSPVRAVVAHACGQDHAIRTEISNPAGSTFWISAMHPPGEDYVNLYSIDITERKRAEEALRESERKYSIVADFTYDWEYWRGPDNRFIYVSPSCETVTGHTREEFLQDPGLFARLIHPDDRERVVRHMREDMASGERCEMEFLIVRRDGQERWMAHVCQPVLDAKGEFIGRRASNRDITERKRAEEALQESEHRVRAKLDAILSPEGDIGTLDLADMIDSAGIQALMEAFHTLARIPMSILDLQGKVLVGVGWQRICMEFHRVHPETCEHCRESDLQLSAGLAPGEVRLYKCKNHMWDIATPIFIGGKHVGNLFSGQFLFQGESLDYALFRDQARRYGFNEKEYIAALEAVPRLSREAVDTGMDFFKKLTHMLSQLSYSNLRLARLLSERDRLADSLRLSEQRLRRAQEISHLGSWELDLTKNELAWSDEVYRIIGLEPQEFGATYEAFLDRVHPDDRAAVDAAYTGSLSENRDTYEIEHRVVRKSDGQVRFVHEKCEHFRDKAGRIIRSVGMVHDITERKRSEEALQTAHAQLQDHVRKLQETNKELENFAYTISHDLRAPLRAINGFARMLVDDYGPSLGEEAKRRLGVIEKNAIKMGLLIDDLLAFSRAGRTAMKVNDLRQSRRLEICEPLKAVVNQGPPQRWRAFG